MKPDNLYLKQAPVLLNSNYYLLQKDPASSPSTPYYSIYETYKQADYLEPVTNLVGFWSSSQSQNNLGGLQLTEVEFWERRQNLSGVTFRTTTLSVSEEAQVQKPDYVTK